MPKLIVQVVGLHCKACEILTEDKLREIKNIKKVSVSRHSGEAEILYEKEKPDIKEIELALKKSGYSLGGFTDDKIISTNKETLNENNKKSLGYWISIFSAIVIIYWLLNRVHIFEFGGMLQSGFSAPLAILIGLVAGLSTCLALVGGLILSISANYAKNHPEATRAQKLKPQIMFNVGRFIGFFVLGGILGILGTGFKMSVLLNSIISIIIGIVITALGLRLLEISPVFNRFDFSLPKRFGRFTKINDPFLLGALSFFLPCGFTQAMQVYALSTGNFITGGTIMALFALGTTPGLLGIGSVSSLFNKQKAKNFFIIAGIIVVAFGLFNLANGYRLFKVSSNVNYDIFSITNNQPTTELNDIETENGKRIIRMTEHNRVYTPNSFTVLKGQPVKWIIDAQAPYSCASALVVPSLNIQTQLQPGENTFEFTPDKIGEIRFSCSMGMYSGKFIVVDDESLLR
jgi:sulfite exporter TauE/SafE/copper chaperone CopZ